MKIENKKAYIPCEVVENQINNGLDIRVRIDKTHDLYINRKLLIPDIDQPEIEVPQMIFDVIESFDEDKDYLHQHMRRQSSGVKEWLTHNERDFYEAYLAYPNITVQKEKLYQIIDKRLNATFSCLGYDIEGRAWFWGNKKFFLKNKGVRLAHTRQQLIDAGFEEVFENPNYEVKEVTK